MVPVDLPPTSILEDNAVAVQSDIDTSGSFIPPMLLPPPSVSENTYPIPMPTSQTGLNLSDSEVDLSILKDEVQDVDVNVFSPDRETNDALLRSPSPISKVEDTVIHAPMDLAVLAEAYSPSSQETDQLSSDISNVEAAEVASVELPVLPVYVELAEDHQRDARRLAIERIINLYQNSERTDFKQTQIALVARLFAQVAPNIPIDYFNVEKIYFFAVSRLFWFSLFLSWDLCFLTFEVL